MKFTEDRLEQAIIELLGKEGYPHTCGEALERAPEDVLLKSDLREFLIARYGDVGITEYEIEQIIHKLEYFVNARIIGTRIRAKAWEILVAMLAMEAFFGIPGLGAFVIEAISGQDFAIVRTMVFLGAALALMLDSAERKGWVQRRCAGLPDQ